MRIATAALVVTLVAASACGGDHVVVGSAAAAPVPPRVAAMAPASPNVASATAIAANELEESDRSRDPFRSFTSLAVPPVGPTKPNQLHTILPQYTIDELKLVAIVLGGEYPRAMVIDPSGKGWMLKGGDYVGRPESSSDSGPGSGTHLLNWRVDRVRDGELVLALEDPTLRLPNGVRIVPLHTEPPATLERL